MNDPLSPRDPSTAEPTSDDPVGTDCDTRETHSLQRLTSRSIRDASGIWWTIVEVRDTRYDRRGTQTLVFSAEGVMRRIRSYPSDWFNLSDRELLALGAE